MKDEQHSANFSSMGYFPGYLQDIPLHFSSCSTSGIRHYCKAKSTDKKTASERFFYGRHVTAMRRTDC
ncbi:MAG: hypothetical protein MJK13_06020 [Pseudomonadales bacterium]|nr:hypothetical protein [Pseudomonadales bacterium]